MNLYDVLAGQGTTHFERLFSQRFAGGSVQTLTGQPPLTFKADGTPLISWSMKGNGSQSGTPTPDNPVMPEFVGVRTENLEPYGYKIPITCAGHTTPVYIGEVPTVRRIKKYEFTGNEQWIIASVGKFYLSNISPDYQRAPDALTYFCSHFPVYPQTNAITNIPDNMLSFGSLSISQRIYCTYTGASTIEEFKAFLDTQYANGTPVTVWYALAEPETGIVNEPLCKIGDYADELHSTDAAVTIPTAKGQNTLTVETDLQPSEMTITYKV